MDRREVNSVAIEIIKVLNEAQSQGKLSKYDINDAGGRFGNGQFTMKISITRVADEETMKANAQSCSDEDIRFGIATANTPITCRVNGGSIQKGLIVKANRKRYVVKGVGGKYDGREFTIPFYCCSLDKEYVS